MNFVCIEKDETGSTQDDARRWLETNPGAVGVWVRTRRQTQGRGRQGRAWQAQVDDLIVSCGLRLPPALRHRPLITLAAGHALYHSLASLAPLSESVFLKWPNDLFWLDPAGGPRKLGGILAESFGQNALVVGWGVNLQGSRQALGTAGGYRAASFEEATGTALSAADVLVSLQRHFWAHLESWQAQPQDFEVSLLESLRQGAMHTLWGLSGRLVKESLPAIARGLDANGALLVEIEGQAMLRPVLSGEFTFFA